MVVSYLDDFFPLSISNLAADGFLMDELRHEEDDEIFADMDMWSTEGKKLLWYMLVCQDSWHPSVVILLLITHQEGLGGF